MQYSTDVQHKPLMFEKVKPAYRRVAQEKEDLRAITLKLQSLLEEKKKAHGRVKFLESRLHLVERENHSTLKQVKHDLGQKNEELCRLLNMSEEKLKTTTSRCTSYITKLKQFESKNQDLRRERENYAAQLSQAEQNLADSNTEKDKQRTLLRQAEREQKGFAHKLENEKGQKRALRHQNLELQDKIKQLEKDSQAHLIAIDDLTRHLVEQSEQHAADERARQKAFDKKQEELRQSFKAKLDEFCTLKDSQYNKDKQNWMEIFRNEVETKMRTLRENNQSFQHTIKVLEEEAERLRKERDIFNADLEGSKQNEERAVQFKEHLQRQLNEQQEKHREIVEKLEREIRQFARENEKMKQVLTKKDGKIAELEREHCSYFAEITALQKVMAEADNTSRISRSSSPFTGTTTRTITTSSSSSHASRKRQRLDDGSGRAVAAEVSSPESHLTFCGVNEDEGYIVIKNGNKRVSLDGFYLRTKSNPALRKKLPASRTLEPHEELRVWTSASPHCKLGDVVWNDFDAKKGTDTCLLYDAKDELHAAYPYRAFM